MNMRYFAFTTFLILSAVCSIAQNYIKLNENAVINERKYLKGEIFEKESEKKILFGKETIDIGNVKSEIINLGDSSKIFDKLRLVQKINDTLYKIDVTDFINNQDTIKLLKHDNNVLLFFNKGSETVSIKDCGAVFRIIIPNMPSIIFYDSEISLPALQNEDTVLKKNFFSNLTWWKYLIIGILGLIILYFIFLFIYWIINRSSKAPIYKNYNGEKLTDFSQKYGISRKKLLKYNKDKFANYESLTDNDKKKLRNSLRGQKLIIGYARDIEEYEFDDDNINQNDNDIVSRLHLMENKILDKIESLSSNKESSKRIENQHKEIENLNAKLTQLNRDNEKTYQESITLKNELTQANKRSQEYENQYLKYSEKVILVDFLEPYAKIVSDYYNYCQCGYYKAIEFYKSINHSDSELVSLISQFLVKFYSSIPEKTTHWIGVTQEIKDRKATTNNDLIRSLKQIENNEEKSKEFKRLLIKEVLEKYTSSIFILSEELSKLSKFYDGNASAVKDFEQFFINFKLELHNKSKAVGLDLNYVPLFENYEKYAAFTKSVNQACSLPYTNIKSISKDTVLEIISYGFENEETNVILA
jgi:outer membrane murein-binding lipoprotein Lpp